MLAGRVKFRYRQFCLALRTHLRTCKVDADARGGGVSKPCKIWSLVLSQRYQSSAITPMIKRSHGPLPVWYSMVWSGVTVFLVPTIAQHPSPQGALFVISSRAVTYLLTCKNSCLQLIQASEAAVRVNKPYEKGFKYCRRCEYYLKTNRRHCSCCGLHLRSTPTIRTRDTTLKVLG